MHRVLGLLSALYAEGLSLPIPPPAERTVGGDAEDVADHVMAWIAADARDAFDAGRRTALTDALHAFIGADDDSYLDVLDPYLRTPVESVPVRVSDDLTTILAWLTRGLHQWRRGEHEAARAAWASSFATWGSHVTGVLRALHALHARHALAVDRGLGGPRSAT